MKLSENLILPNRNVIINGDMSIWQRGESAANISTGVQAADRIFLANYQTTAVVNVSKIPSALNEFPNALRYEVAANGVLQANSTMYIGQRIEGINCQRLGFGQPNKKITFSFWCRSSKAGIFTIIMFAGSGRALYRAVTIDSANTWEKKVVTVPTDPTISLLNDNSRQLEVLLILDSGEDRRAPVPENQWVDYEALHGQWTTINLNETQGATFDLTGVQLEAGDVATPFEHLPYQENLNRCWRYYYLSGLKRIAGLSYVASGGAGLTTTHSLPTQMRSQPTISFPYTSDGGANSSIQYVHIYPEHYDIDIRSTDSTNTVFMTYRIEAKDEL